MTWYSLLAGVRILGGSAEKIKISGFKCKVTNAKHKDIKKGLKKYFWSHSRVQLHSTICSLRKYKRSEIFIWKTNTCFLFTINRALKPVVSIGKFKVEHTSRRKTPGNRVNYIITRKPPGRKKAFLVKHLQFWTEIPKWSSFT